MTKLTVISACCGTRLRRDGCHGPLVLAKSDDTPCCCNGCVYFWFAICNINAAVDDNMNVSINGKNLGVMDLNANARVGWIIHTGPQPTKQQIPWDGDCYDNAVFKKIAKTDLQVGGNNVSTTLAQANNNGNYGIWTAGLWSKNEDESCPTLASSSYGNPPQTFSWNLTQEQYDSLLADAN